jgi:GDP-L-fucose synthase
MKTVVTGHTGLLGSEILNLKKDAIGFNSSQSNLLENDFYNSLPSTAETVIHCAAKVGGVKANTEFVSDFFEENMRMNSNVMRACKKRGIKLVSILSTCIYPDKDYVTYPLTEDQLHNGPPHQSNFGYAYAKRMIDVQTRAYRQQHGCNFITAIPNNLYGLNDNYDLQSGHVIPSLIRKFHEAKISNSKKVIIWGTGSPLREFTFARDAARIILWLSENYDGEKPVNIGNPEQISIKRLAEMIGEKTGFKGDLVFDSEKPDGQFEKPSSNEYLRSLGWSGDYTNLNTGLEETILFFQTRYPNLRGLI